MPTPAKRKGRRGSAIQMMPDDPDKTVPTLAEPPGRLTYAGRALWDEAMTNAKWFSTTDGYALFTTCLMYERLIDIDDRYRRYVDQCDGHIFDADATRMSKELTAISDRLFKHLIELGLTPKSRSDMGVAEVKLRSKMEEFIQAQQSKKRWTRDDPGHKTVKGNK